MLAANGVSYRVAKLQSTIRKDHFCRGKFYEFLGVAPSHAIEISNRLLRHAEVCDRFKKSSSNRIARHRWIVRLAEETAWWICDDWIEGKTLSSHLTVDTRFSLSQIKSIGTEILLALDELHQNKIVFRELTPDQIYLSDGFKNCTLTDFELAKVLLDVPTVSGPWLTRNPYRAPEHVEKNRINWANYAGTDIYSWGAIMIELLTGNPEAESEELSVNLTDKKLVEFLLGCRNPVFTQRPETVQKVLEVWNQWPAKKK